jgi:hypothetical protein
MTRLHPRALAAAGIVSLGALLLSGCSSSSPTAAAAHPSSSTSGSAAGSAAGAAQFTAYRNCLSQHGITMPTGRPGGGGFSRNPSDRPSFSRNPSDRPSGGYKGGGGFGFGGASANPSAQAALKACASLAPTSGFGGGRGGFGGGGAGGTALAAFTSCMKDHGVTVTPQQLRSITSSTDAKTVAALKVCKPLLPAPGGAPGATPPATPSS